MPSLPGLSFFAVFLYASTAVGKPAQGKVILCFCSRFVLTFYPSSEQSCMQFGHLTNSASSAASFCPQYLTATSLSVPSWVGTTGGSALTSACSCFRANAATTVTTSTPAAVGGTAASTTSSYGSVSQCITTAIPSCTASTITNTITITETAASNGTQLSDILAIEANIQSLESAIMSAVSTLTLPPSTITSTVTLPQTTITALLSPSAAATSTGGGASWNIVENQEGI
jgi:hypothetical protein